MRIRTVLIWFIIAGLLAAAVALSRRSATQTTTTSQAGEPWTIPLDPARLASIELIAAGNTISRVDRVAMGVDRWNLTWSTDTGSSTWQADPERVRAAVRLTGSTPITTTDTYTADTEPTAVVRFTEIDGRSVDIAFADRASGGQVAVIADVRDESGLAERRIVGRLPAANADAFVRTPWTAWRDSSLFDAVTANARALSISAGPNSVRLERGSSGWAITSPFTIQADTPEVERALGTISGLRAGTFVDAPPPDETTGLALPIATISVESATGITRLDISQATAVSGSDLFARITTPDTSAVIHIDRESIAQLTAAAAAYARRTPLGISPADISRIEFTAHDGRSRFEARRAAGTWRIDSRDATPDQRDAINRMLTVMTLEPAAQVATLAPDHKPDNPLGEMRFLTDEGLPLAALTLAIGPELRLLTTHPTPSGLAIQWTSATENAKAVAIWTNALATRKP